MIARLRSARNRELAGILLAGLIAAAGFGAVYMAREQAPSNGSLLYAGLFVALYLVAHAGVRLLLPDADPFLLPLTAVLTAVGLTEIYRISPLLARDQAIWIVLGVGLFLAVIWAVRDVRVLERYRYTAGILALLLLAATMVLGTSVYGARLWIRFGGLQIQPGEFAKILLVVFLAGYLRETREVLAAPPRRVLGVGVPAMRHALPLLVIAGAALVALAAMNDFGTALLLFGTVLAMLWVATGRVLYVAAGLSLFAVGAVGVAHYAAHVRTRVTVWLDPWKDPQGAGFQIVQSIYTVADGGLFGRGLGRGFILLDNGRPLVPDIQTDFIYSAIATETGLAGTTALLLVYLLIAWRGFKIATLADDGFSKLLAVGLTVVFALQTFVIVGGVIKLIPLTGLTLPFVAYGGSSIVSNFALLGLLLAVSQRANRSRA